MCRNGCGKYITVQEDSGKWKPFDVSEDGDVLDLHNCPNSPYNKGMSGGSFPTQTQQQTKKPSGGKGSFSIAMPSSTNISSAGETLDVKRIRVMLQDFQSSIETLKADIRGLNERLEANTQIDTNKLIGQLQQMYDFMAKSEKLPIAKPASELFKIPKDENNSEEDPSEEFQRMKQFTKVGDDDTDEDEDDTKGRTTGGIED